MAARLLAVNELLSALTFIKFEANCVLSLISAFVRFTGVRSLYRITMAIAVMSYAMLASPLLYASQLEPCMIVLEPVGPDAGYRGLINESLTEPIAGSESEIEVLDWSKNLASQYVESLNDGVDSFFMGAFFDDEIIEDESSGSNGRVFLTSRREKGQSLNIQSGINLKVVLPRTRDRFKLLLETDENEDGDAESSVIDTTKNVTYSTAVRVEIQDGEKWKTSLDNGVRWSGKPVYFSRIRTRRTDYFEEWRTRYLQSIYWRTDVEWGAIVDMNALTPIDFSRHFRMGFSADYNLNDDMAELRSSIAVFDEINYQSALLYQLAVFGDTKVLTRVNEAVLSISYRRKIYKSFLFAEVVPEIGFPRDLDYDATPALTFTLEMIFGPDL
jgi:hypothetical protein